MLKQREIKECVDCGGEVLTDDHCDYCGLPLHPDAPLGQQGRCSTNHENECDQNPDNE